MFKANDLAEIVLVDFGISNILKDNESTKIFGLSIPYCPPELNFASACNISEKADIFSFGMLLSFFIIIFIRILYEIITENFAFCQLRFKLNKLYAFIRSENYDFFSENIRTGINEID